ncbi:MAG: PAS domain S-box protein [Bacteroidales bacterium]|nr:PAS domain S-box protein [Bacteroidales bacterium]
MNRKETRKNKFELLNYVNKGMFVTDQKLILLFWNKNLENSTGILNSEIIGKSLIEQFKDLESKEFKNIIKKIAKNKAPIKITFENEDDFFPSVLSKNYKKHFDVNQIPSSDNSQNYLIFSLEELDTAIAKQPVQKSLNKDALQEIHFLRNSIEKLSESKKNLERILSTSSEGFFIIDNNAIIDEVNDAMCRILSRPKEKILGKALSDFLNNENKKKLKQELIKRATGRSSIYEIELLLPDFTSIFCIFHATPHYDNAGMKIGSFVMVSDITNHKNTENELNNYKKNLEKLIIERSEKLITSEEKYRKLTETLTDGVFTIDFNGNFTYLNQTCEKITGYLIDDFIGKSFTKIIAPKYIKSTLEKFKLAKSGNELPLYEIEILHKNKGSILVELNVSSLYDYNKNIIGRIGSFRDITKRKETEDRLRENEEKFRSISISAQDAIIIMDNDGNISFWNKAAEKMFNYSYQEAIGQYLHKFIAPEHYFDGFNKNFPEFQKSGKGNAVGKTLELSAIKKDGTEFPISLSLSVVKLKGKWNALGIIRDISQIKEAEAEIKSSEQNFKALAENSFECIAINDKQGNYLYTNTKTSELTGYSIKELLKLNVKDLTPQQDVEIVMKRVRRRVEGKSALKNFESNLLRKDGKIVPVEILATKTEWHKKPADMVFFHDISVRKQAEEKLKKQTIELKERNEELDAFAHTVAHDLKNPLGAVIGFSELLNDEFSDLSENEIQQFIQHIYKGSNKMKNIIDGLLLLSSLRKTEVKTEVLNMNRIIEEAIDRNSQLIEKNNAEIVFPEKWPGALGFAPWVEEVWVNYINNAIKYGGEPPKIELGFDTENSDKSDKKMMRFWVRDNGKGISRENQKRLFKQFERLDQVKIEGHGLGLSIVRRIIEKLDGRVGVESYSDNDEKGSIFYFTLPIENN